MIDNIMLPLIADYLLELRAVQAYMILTMHKLALEVSSANGYVPQPQHPGASMPDSIGSSYVPDCIFFQAWRRCCNPVFQAMHAFTVFLYSSSHSCFMLL